MQCSRYVLALAFAALGACARAPDVGPTGEAKMVVQVYEVPAESTDKMQFALRELLRSGGKQPLGNVTSPAPGQLLVLAPPDLQDSIAAALKEVRNANGTVPAASAAKQLRLDYWNIDAISGNGADDPALAALAPALAKFRKNLGDVHFQLNNHASGLSSSGQKVTTHYATAVGPGGSSLMGALEYTLRIKPEGIQLDVELSDQTPRAEAAGKTVQYVGTRFSTAIILRPGETVVLSDNPAIGGGATDAAAARSKAVRLNVIRVEENSST